MLYRQHPDTADLYKDVFKMYYFAEKGMSAGRKLNGLAKDETKAASIYAGENNSRGGHNEDTPAHELLHCFTLPHTFYETTIANALPKYMFAQYKTDNIMDYKETTTTPTYTSIWQMQMQQVWNFLKMK